MEKMAQKRVGHKADKVTLEGTLRPPPTTRNHSY